MAIVRPSNERSREGGVNVKGPRCALIPQASSDTRAVFNSTEGGKSGEKVQEVHFRNGP